MRQPSAHDLVEHADHSDRGCDTTDQAGHQADPSPDRTRDTHASIRTRCCGSSPGRRDSADDQAGFLQAL